MNELIALLTFCAFLAVVFAGLAPQLRQDNVYRAVTFISALWICLITFIPFLRLCIITTSAIGSTADRLLEMIIWRFTSPPNKLEIALFLFTLVCMVCYFHFIGQMRVYVADVQKCLPIEFGEGEIEVDASSHAEPTGAPQPEKATQSNGSPQPDNDDIPAPKQGTPRRHRQPDGYDPYADWKPRPKRTRDPKRIVKKRSAPAVIKKFERFDSAIEFVPVTSHPALKGYVPDAAHAQHVAASNASVVLGSATPLLANAVVPAVSRPPTRPASYSNLPASQLAVPSYAANSGVARSAASATARVSKRRPGRQSIKDRRRNRAMQKDGQNSTPMLDKTSVSTVTPLPDQKEDCKVSFASEAMVRRSSPLPRPFAGPEAVPPPSTPPSSSEQDSSKEHTYNGSTDEQPIQAFSSAIYKPWTAPPHMSLVPRCTEETEDDGMSIASLDHEPPPSPTMTVAISEVTLLEFETMFNKSGARTRLPVLAEPSAGPFTNQPQNCMAQKIRVETTEVDVSQVNTETVDLTSEPVSPIMHEQQEEHSQQEADNNDIPMEEAEAVASPTETMAPHPKEIQRTKAGPEVSMGDGEAAPPPSTPDGEQGDMPQGSSIQPDNDIAMGEDEAIPTPPNPGENQGGINPGWCSQPDQDISMNDDEATAMPTNTDDQPNRADQRPSSHRNQYISMDVDPTTTTPLTTVDQQNDTTQRESSKLAQDVPTGDDETAASPAIPVDAKSDTKQRDFHELNGDIPKSDATTTAPPSSVGAAATSTGQGDAAVSQPAIPAPSPTTRASSVPPAVQIPSVVQGVPAPPTAPISAPTTVALPPSEAPATLFASLLPKPAPFPATQFGRPNPSNPQPPQHIRPPAIEDLKPASNPLLTMSDSDALAQISAWLLPPPDTPEDTLFHFKMMPKAPHKSWAWAQNCSILSQELYWQLLFTLSWATEPSSWDPQAMDKKLPEYYVGKPCPLKWRAAAKSLVPALKVRALALDDAINKGLTVAVSQHHVRVGADAASRNVHFLPDRALFPKMTHLLRAVQWAT